MPVGLVVGATIMAAGVAWALTIAWLVAKYEDA